MTFAAPYALCGLVLLPLLWWWARRRMQPLVVSLPSLMFLMEEDERLHAPRKRELDWETRVALVALTFLILAAAGPSIGGGEAGRRVRVVRASAAPRESESARDGVDRRVAKALDAIREQLGDEDELVVVDLPAEEWGRSEDAPPSPDAVYAAARAEDADVRIVLVDRLPEDAPTDIAFIGVGAAGARNLAWVAANFIQTGEGPVLHAVLRNQGSVSTRASVRWGDAEQREVTLAAGAHQALRFAVVSAPGESTALVVSASDPAADERARDNRVDLQLRPVRLGYGDTLPERHRALVRDALMAVVGPLGVVEPPVGPFDFFVGTPKDPVPPARVRLLLEPLDAGALGRASPPGSLVGPTDPRTADLRGTGAHFFYREGVDRLREGERALLEVAYDGGASAVLAVGRDGVLRLAPDPLAGAPAPAATAFMPLLCSNLLAGVGTVGLQRTGLEHPARSLIGSYAQSLDPAWLRGAYRGRTAEHWALRRPLIVLAALLLLLLWWLPGRLEARA